MKNSKVKLLLLLMAGLLIFAYLPLAVAAGTTSTTQVVAWGDNRYHACDVPEGLTDVTAIAAGAVHTVALVNNTGYTVSFDANGGIPVPTARLWSREQQQWLRQLPQQRPG